MVSRNSFLDQLPCLTGTEYLGFPLKYTPLYTYNYGLEVVIVLWFTRMLILHSLITLISWKVQK